MSLIGSSSSLSSSAASALPVNNSKASQELPKCFGTDYFGKWTMSGMTFESMRIDRPEWQSKCGACAYFERCYKLNHIRLMRIKK